MSRFMQPGITYLTEEEIFSLPTLNRPPAGGEGVGDGPEEENVLALGCSDSEMSEVFQMLLENLENDAEVQDKADHQQVQPAKSSDVQHVQKSSARACVTQCKQMWAPKEGLEQVVQKCTRRPQQRKAAKASSSNAKPRPIPPKKKKFLGASVQPKVSLKRVVERKWVDVEKEKALAVLFAKQTALIMDAKAFLEPYGLYCIIPRLFPNSRLIHPFLEITPDTTVLPNMYPVLNSSDFAHPSASVQQAISPTEAADHIFKRQLPYSAAQVQIFANPYLAHMYRPATMTPPTAPLVNHFPIQAPTTRIDRLEEEQVSMPIQYGPDLMSSDSEYQLDINYGPSFTTTTTHMDPAQVLDVSSPLFPEDIQESTFLEQAVLVNQVFSNAHTAAASSSLEQQQQGKTAAHRVTNAVQFVMGIRKR